MVDVPNPLQLITGRGAAPGPGPDADDEPATITKSQVNVGGRHGSPSVVVGMPFSSVKVQEVDPVLRPAALELARLTASLAELVGQVAGRLGEADGDDAGDPDGTAGGLDALAAAVAEVRDRATALAAQLAEDEAGA